MWQAVLGKEGPPTVFVGHSMGGAIATWAANRQVRLRVLPTMLPSCICSKEQERMAVTGWHCKGVGPWHVPGMRLLTHPCSISASIA